MNREKIESILAFLAKAAIFLFLAWFLSRYAFSSDYGRLVKGADGAVWRAYWVTTPYTYCGRTYYRGYWRYQKVASYKSPDWRQKILNLIDDQKERESFDDALDYLGARGIMSEGRNYHQYSLGQQASLYPSQTGKTLGAFTRVQYNRYGDTTTLDMNRASELAQQGVDSYTRLTAEARSQAETTARHAGDLQRLNLERVGAIGELQETRATLKEMMVGLTQQTLAQSQLVQSALSSMKPKDSESFEFEQGAGGDVLDRRTGGRTPPASFSPQVPENHQEVVRKYCATCHSGASPKGGLRFDGDSEISEGMFGSIALRVDPNAPQFRSDGTSLYAMPPEGSEQPTVEDRRLIVDAAKSFVRK